jgi:hypothetical protein
MPNMGRDPYVRQCQKCQKPSEHPFGTFGPLLVITEYEGEKIRLPSVAEAAPDARYLQEHRNLMGFA